MSDTPNSPAGEPTSSKAPEIALPEPRLEVYFGVDEITAASFVKAVRSSDIFRFPDSDVEAGHTLSRETDPEHSRLLSLVQQTNIPEAVERWLGSAIQRRLQDQINDFDPTLSDAHAILLVVCRHVSSTLFHKEKDARRKSENTLRLALHWLSRYRSLRSHEAFRALSQLFFAERREALRMVDKTLQFGRLGEIQLSAATHTLSDESVRLALVERDKAAREAFQFREQAAELRQRIHDAGLAISSLQTKIGALEGELEEARLEYAQKQRAWEYERLDSNGRLNSLYKERLIPLLTDAVDALEIGPEHAAIAIERIKSALSILEEVAI